MLYSHAVYFAAIVAYVSGAYVPVPSQTKIDLLTDVNVSVPTNVTIPPVINIESIAKDATLPIANNVTLPIAKNATLPAQANATTIAQAALPEGNVTEASNITVKAPLTNELGIRTLILGNKESTIIPRNILEAYGSHYDVFTNSLFADLRTNNWHSIVVADKDVDMKGVREYAKRTHARIVVLESSHQDDALTGVKQVALGACANITVAASPDVQKIAGVLNQNGNWDICETSPSAVEIVDPAMATPFLEYQNKQGKLAAYVSKTKFDTEEMHFDFKAYDSGIHDDFTIEYELPTEYSQINLALGHAWYEWVTRGVFMGERRMTLNLHVDDWYHECEALDTKQSFRVNDADIEHYVDWRRTLHTRLPAGSDFKLEPAFNGAGQSMLGLKENGISAATYKYAHEFNWVSHTWTHMNMDWLEADNCITGKYQQCHPDAERFDAEFGYNQRFARGEAIPNTEYIKIWNGWGSTPAHQFLDNRTDLMEKFYSPKSLVTPEISGLWPADYFKTHKAPGDPSRRAYPKNTLFFERLTKAGIWNVVGDNSRDELRPKNIYHGIISDRFEYGVEGVLIMPRLSPNLAWDCPTYHCVQEFYYGVDRACDWISYGPACPKERLSGPAIINREAKASTIPMLQLRYDAQMFHQANVHAQEYNGKQVPMVGQFAEETFNDVMRYVNQLPIISYKMDTLSQMYRDRMHRDACNIKGSISIDANGNAHNINVSGDICKAVVTITDRAGINTTANNYESTRYGPDSNNYLYMFGAQSSLPVQGRFY